MSATPGLRRLPASALEFAEHMPVLARTAEVSVSESLVAGVLLVPNHGTERGGTALAWVTPRMVPQQEGPPAVHQAAMELTAAAAAVGPAVRQAQYHLAQHRAATADPARRAVAAAVSHAGAARSQLRTVLSQRLSEQSAVLSATLPAHPRPAPHRPDSPAHR